MTASASGTNTTGVPKPSIAAPTPGPWRWTTGQFGVDGIKNEQDDYVLFASCEEAYGSYYAYIEIDNKADAHLIVAAPDMLEALKVARVYMADYWQSETVLFQNSNIGKKINAAIKKATGEA